jgi:5-methylcytosine-specific restriction endonuclease McrA
MKNRHRYHPNWNDIIRPEILKRDKYRCTNCGLKHRGLYLVQDNGKVLEIDKEEYIEALRNDEKVKKIFLQVAHLDHNPSNNAYDNLKSFCPSCHLSNDRIFNQIKRKSKLNL